MNNKSIKTIDNRRSPGAGLPGACGSVLPLLLSLFVPCQAKAGHPTLSSGADTSLPPQTPQIPQILQILIPPAPNRDRLSHMMTVPPSLLVPCQLQPRLQGAASLPWLPDLKTPPHPRGPRGEGAQTTGHCWDFLLGKELWPNEHTQE